MDAEETVADLLDAWSSGDDGAGNRLLERYFDRLLVFFGARSDVDVEDLVQRTMMSCLQARSKLRSASSFRAFLFTVARHELIDHRRRRDVVREEEAPSELVCERTTPSGFALARQRRHGLARALLRLGVEVQVAVALHYWEGMTHAELAEVLAIPLGTVKSRLRAARAELRTLLTQEGTAADAEATLESLGAWARARGAEA